METCGLTAEYNPFHRGHARQLESIREILGHDIGIVVCLSGPFCQHGVPALLDKGIRTRIVLNQGADLVLELPQAFALASAERFAEGAIGILRSTGVVRHIAYGCEHPEDQDAIRRIAALLADEPKELYDVILEGIRDGKGYAAARSDAVTAWTNDGRHRMILESPNSILAVEYEKVLRRRDATEAHEHKGGAGSHEIRTLALPLFDKQNQSSAAVRRVVSQACAADNPATRRGIGSLLEIFRYLSGVLTCDSAAAVMKALSEGKGLVTEEMIGPSLLLSPLFRDVDALKEIIGMQGGLAERLCGALRDDPLNVLRKHERTDEADSPLPYDDFIRETATRAHPSSRVRRAMLAAAFGIKDDDKALCHDGPQYIRVLGFTRRGRRLLSFMRHTAALPVVMNASDYRSLKTESARRQAKLDLYTQAWWNHHASLDHADEFKRSAIILKA